MCARHTCRNRSARRHKRWPNLESRPLRGLRREIYFSRTQHPPAESAVRSKWLGRGGRARQIILSNSFKNNNLRDREPLPPPVVLASSLSDKELSGRDRPSARLFAA